MATGSHGLHGGRQLGLFHRRQIPGLTLRCRRHRPVYATCSFGDRPTDEDFDDDQSDGQHPRPNPRAYVRSVRTTGDCAGDPTGPRRGFRPYHGHPEHASGIKNPSEAGKHTVAESRCWPSWIKCSQGRTKASLTRTRAVTEEIEEVSAKTDDGENRRPIMDREGVYHQHRGQNHSVVRGRQPRSYELTVEPVLALTTASRPACSC